MILLRKIGKHFDFGHARKRHCRAADNTRPWTPSDLMAAAATE